MFDYKEYTKDFEKIKKEELKNWSDDIDIDDFDDFSIPYIEKRSLLNKKYNIVFKHNLKDAWNVPIDEFFLINSSKDNVIIVQHKKVKYYNVAKKDIEKIIELLNKNNALFKEGDVAFPPVLDGTSHEIYISNGNEDKEISCFNLWYWLEEDVDGEYSKATELEKKYTKNMIELIREIQLILDSNNIKYKILAEE